MRQSEVKRLERDFRTARSECSRLGGLLMEVRLERDQLKRELADMKRNAQDALSWACEVARERA